MSQSHLHWNERVKFGRGEKAETQFLAWAEKNGILALRYGFDIPPEAGIGARTFLKLPLFIRLTPDFACMGKEGGFLVEVKGCGKGGLKIKDETMEALYHWNEQFASVSFFIYNSSTHACALCSFDKVQALCSDVPTSYFESDNKPYSLIPTKNFVWEKL